jgi:quercetin dioxygenase-like cupin family protein
MNIVEKPIAAIIGRLTSTGDGIHMIANSYRKGHRIHTHMHREAQLVYAAKGTMQVTTPKGRWLVPPDRAVWVPALSEHAIDVLADIEMRTLYFELEWLQREARSHSLAAEFVVRVSPLLHQTMLALFDDRGNRERTELLLRLAMMELDRAEDSTTFIPLPPRRRHRARRPCGFARHRASGAQGRHLGAHLVAAVRSRDAHQFQELVPACPHRRRHRALGRASAIVGQAGSGGYGLRELPGFLPRVSTSHRQDTDGVFGGAVKLIAVTLRVLLKSQASSSAKADDPVAPNVTEEVRVDTDYWILRLRGV